MIGDLFERNAPWWGRRKRVLPESRFRRVCVLKWQPKQRHPQQLQQLQQRFKTPLLPIELFEAK